MTERLVRRKMDISPNGETPHWYLGLGVMIFNRRGEFAVVTEAQTRKESGKEKGQVTIPLESEKEGSARKPETVYRNLLGAMAEVVNDRILRDVGPSFHLVTQPLEIFPVSQNLSAGLVIVRFDGDPDYQLVPTATDEIERVQWMNEETFLYGDLPVRPSGKELVGSISLREASLRKPTRRLFHRGFASIEAFYWEREMHADMSPNGRFI